MHTDRYIYAGAFQRNKLFAREAEREIVHAGVQCGKSVLYATVTRRCIKVVCYLPFHTIHSNQNLNLNLCINSYYVFTLFYRYIHTKLASPSSSLYRN